MLFRFDLQDFNHLAVPGDLQDIVYYLHTSQISSAFVDNDLARNTIAGNGFIKDTPCCTEIPAFREHEIKYLAISVNGSVQIGPLTTNLDIGLVNTSGTAVGRLRYCALAAISGGYRTAHRFKVAWSAAMPRSARIS
jgi:hypothetical protein